MRALIVDDEEAIRFTLRSLLQEEGFDVVEATDGEQAIREIRAAAFDVVVLDVVMPNKGGIEVLMELKREFPKLPFVIVSGIAQLDSNPFRNLVGKLGVRHVLEKPIDKEALLQAVRRAIAEAAG